MSRLKSRLTTGLAFALAAWLALLCPPADADLPIHALSSDVLGLWRILETGSFHAEPQLCGGTLPNSNVENLKLGDYRRFLESSYGELKESVVELLDERHHRRSEVPPRNQWRFLGVRDPRSGHDFIGSWTMVYDEGLDIEVGPVRYFGYFKYSKIESHECPMVLEGSQEDSTGDVPCYKTRAAEIGLGWSSRKIYKDGKPSYMYGCFYAEKVNKGDKHSYVLDESAAVELPKARPRSSLWEKKSYSQFTDLSPFRFLQLHKGVSFKSIHHSHVGDRSGGDPLAPAASRFMQRDAGPTLYACKTGGGGGDYYKELALPKQWSWSDSSDGAPDDLQPFSQGQCGSCYAMASIYVLAKRFEIMLRKLYPQRTWEELPRPSVQDVVECSPFGQGCFGGFPFLVGKHLTELGVRSASESPYKMYLESSEPRCSDRRFDSSRRWFASAYGYVGGCYECTTELEIMKEVYHHGPVAVAIDAPQSLFSYRRGIYDDDPANHGSTCDLPLSGLNGWEYTNHAIAIVGWGEEEVDGSLTKFWLCRNTWGNSWGSGGFFKVKRGVNQCGIESQAVFIDPDLTRGLAAQLLGAV